MIWNYWVIYFLFYVLHKLEILPVESYDFLAILPSEWNDIFLEEYLEFGKI